MANRTPQNFEMDEQLLHRIRHDIEAVRSRIQIFIENNVGGGSRHSGLSDEQIQKLPSTKISKQ